MARAVAHAGSSRPLIAISDQLTLPIYTQIRLIEYHADQIDRKIFPMTLHLCRDMILTAAESERRGANPGYLTGFAPC